MAVRKLTGQFAAWLALLGLVLSGFAPVAAGSAAAAVYKAPALEALTVADVQRIIAQAAGEAKARGPRRRSRWSTGWATSLRSIA